MWSSGRRVLQELLSQPAVRSFSLSPAQNTVVVERWWQVPLSKVGSPPRLHPRRHKIYKLVEDTKNAPKQKMELILTQTVDKLGGRGDTVFVKKSVGRNKLLANGMAVYPSPENKAMFAEESQLYREELLRDRPQTRTGKMTVEFLKRCTLKIHKMPSEHFQLNKDVVHRQFIKRLGVVVQPRALSLPFESVTELGDYWCDVTVNGIDTVRVPISLVPYEDYAVSRQMLKQQKQQQKEAEAAAAEAGEKEQEEEDVLKAEGAAAVEADAAKDSAAEETVETTQMAQESPAPPSEDPKTK